jgi:DNA-binding response OmpR family regulator
MADNIIVIDSDPEAARAAAKALEAEGYLVFIAAKADVGLTMAKKVRPSLVLLELSTPGVEGLEFCKSLRSLEGLQELPILLYSKAQEQYEPRYQEMYGIVGFLKKPVDASELVAQVRQALRQPVETAQEAAMAFEEPLGQAEQPQEVFPEAPEEVPYEPPQEAQELRENLLRPRTRKTVDRRRTLLLALLVVLLAAAASFSYFMFLAPKKAPVEVKERVPEKPVAKAPAPPEAKAPAKKPPQVAKKAPVYSVQVGAFRNRANARRLMNALKAKGYEARLKQLQRGGKPLYKVLVGSFSSREEALATAKRLSSKEGLKTVLYRD